MKNKNEQVLILRTIYLNPENDEELRKLAFDSKISKASLIRRLIEIGLKYKDEI